jgi:hypothetical protein
MKTVYFNDIYIFSMCDEHWQSKILSLGIELMYITSKFSFYLVVEISSTDLDRNLLSFL